MRVRGKTLEKGLTSLHISWSPTTANRRGTAQSAAHQLQRRDGEGVGPRQRNWTPSLGGRRILGEDGWLGRGQENGVHPGPPAPPARPTRSAGPHRSPPPHRQQEAPTPEPYLSARAAAPRAGPLAEAEGTARAGASGGPAAPLRPPSSRDPVGTPRLRRPVRPHPRPRFPGSCEPRLPARSSSSSPTTVGRHLPSIAMMCSPRTAPTGWRGREPARGRRTRRAAGDRGGAGPQSPGRAAWRGAAGGAEQGPRALRPPRKWKLPRPPPPPPPPARDAAPPPRPCPQRRAPGFETGARAGGLRHLRPRPARGALSMCGRLRPAPPAAPWRPGPQPRSPALLPHLQPQRRGVGRDAVRTMDRSRWQTRLEAPRPGAASDLVL